jgi:hypothetical protein
MVRIGNKRGIGRENSPARPQLEKEKEGKNVITVWEKETWKIYSLSQVKRNLIFCSYFFKEGGEGAELSDTKWNNSHSFTTTTETPELLSTKLSASSHVPQLP